jgi:hypothetical protein
MMTMKNAIYFRPWMPNNYGMGKYGRLLLLGESHYYDDEKREEDQTEKREAQEKLPETLFEVRSNFSSKVIQEYLSGGHNHKYFGNIGRMFNPGDKYEVWREAAFANLIQNPLARAMSQPSEEDLATIASAFDELLTELRPTKVIVLSARLWEQWLPPEPENGFIVQEGYEVEGRKSNVWKYKYSGHCSYVIGISHPSKGAYSKWGPLVRQFVSESFP